MTIPVLEYHNQANDGPLRRPWLRAIFFGVALLAVAAIFVPFYFGVSPWDVGKELISKSRDGETMIYLLGLPFFFAVPLALWKLRLLLWPRGKIFEWALAWIAWGLAMLLSFGVAVNCILDYLEDTPPRDPEMFLGLISIAIHIAFGLGGIWLTWRRTRSPDAMASCALIVALLSNSIMCLILFRDDPNIGWWFTLVASGGLLAELIVTLILGRRGF